MRFLWWLIAAFRRDQSDYLEMSHERRYMNTKRYEHLAVMLVAGIIWTGPKLTPAQGAQILARNQTPVTPRLGHGPTFVVLPSPPPAPERPARRLDGTLFTQPVQVYGEILWRRHDQRLPR